MTHFIQLRSVLLLAVLAMAGGCGTTKVIVVTGPPEEPPPDATVVYVDDAATIAEIDAASDLSFSSHRQQHLKRIATRPNIGPRAQVYLANQAIDHLNFDSHRLDVLLTLIANDVFSVEAKEAVLHRLKDLHFDSHRRRVLDALDRRGPPVVFPQAPQARL